MGEVVGAAMVAHVPTIVMDETERRELNAGQEISLVPGLQRMRREVFDRLNPDTVVVFDTHWFTTFEFVVSAHARRSGRYTSDELPRGMCQRPYDFPGDPELAGLMADDRRAGRHLDHADRRPVPADPLPDRQPVAVPAGLRALGVDLDTTDRRDRRLPARRHRRSATPSPDPIGA